MTQPQNDSVHGLGQFTAVSLATGFGGILIGVLGLVLKLVLVVRLGLLLVVVSMALGAGWRFLAWAQLKRRPPVYGIVSIGIRVVAALVVLLAALKLRL